MFWQIFDPSVTNTFVRVTGGIVNTNVSFLYQIFVFAGLVLAVSIHEFSHAWSAYILGDETAKMNDRLTLNPFKHFDVTGLLLILFTFFGYGKPVPVNPNNFKNPVQGLVFTSLAGPASNFLQALVYAMLFLVLKTIPPQPDFLTTLTYSLPTIGFINLALMVFNLLPIPPLDGSKIWGYLSPAVDDFITYRLAPYSIIIIILLILPIIGGYSIMQLMLVPIAGIYFGFLGL